MKKQKILALILLAMLLLSGCGKEVITVAGIQDPEQETDYIEIKEFQLKEETTVKDGQEVSCCAVLIPAGYQEVEGVPGMYVHERSPLDSSNIYYTVSEGDGDGVVSDELTEKIYKEEIEEAYREAGQDIEMEIQSFERIDMEGTPGYKIRSIYRIEEQEIEQLAYLILAEDTYTVTYSQLAGDELMADFEVSDGQIRLVKDEEALASSK